MRGDLSFNTPRIHSLHAPINGQWDEGGRLVTYHLLYTLYIHSMHEFDHSSATMQGYHPVTFDPYTLQLSL